MVVHCKVIVIILYNTHFMKYYKLYFLLSLQGGKGRTGVVVASYMYYSKQAERWGAKNNIGGGGVYSYIHVLSDRFLFKLRNLKLI